MTTVRLCYPRKKIDLRVRIDDNVTDLRKYVKDSLKLQVSKRYIRITKPTGHDVTGSLIPQGNNAQNLEQVLTYNVHNHKAFMNQAKNSCIQIGIETIDLGDFVCTGEELGSGSFSQVYKGYVKQNPNQLVAVKVIDSQLLETDKAREYHENEKKVLAMLNHPNIVKVHKMLTKQEEDGNYFYFIMEYCAGGSLDSHIHGKPLSETTARRCLSQLASGLKHLFQNRIIHRDLKPQNILLTSSDIVSADLKICDFGFSRFVGDELLKSHPHTPLYAAPQLLYHKPYSHKADLWSVGVIFYEMLTGEGLFKVTTMQELQNAVNSLGQISFPPNIKLSRECIQLVHQLLEKEDSKRISWEQFFDHPFLQGLTTRTIHSVPEGEGYEVAVTELTNVLYLKQILSSYVHIPVESAVILVDDGEGSELTNDTFLMNMGKAWENHAHMFMYNTNDLLVSLDRTPPLPSIEEVMNSPLQLSQSDMPFKKLIEFQQNFKLCAARLQAVLNSCEKSHQMQKLMVHPLQTQARALDVCWTHFNSLKSHLDLNCSSLDRIFKDHSQRSTFLLTNFEVALNKMRNIPLVEALTTPQRKTLYDTLDMQNIQKKFQQFQHLHSDLKNWLVQLEDLRGEIRILQTTILGGRMRSSSASTTSPVLKSHNSSHHNNNNQSTSPRGQNTNASSQSGKSVLFDENNVIQKLRFQEQMLVEIDTAILATKQDYDKATQVLDMTRESHSHQPTMPVMISHDVIECLITMLQSCDQQMKRALEVHSEINSHLKGLTQEKTQIYAQILSIFQIRGKMLHLLGTLPSKQRQLVDYQVVLKGLTDEILGLPEAYSSYLDEMNRRRRFEEIYVRRSLLAREYFQKTRDEENARLNVFYQSVGKSLQPLIFVGADRTEQEMVNVSIPGMATPASFLIHEKKSSNVDDLSSDFEAIVVEDLDPKQLRKENLNLRSELLELQRKFSDNNMSTLLAEVSRLREEAKRSEDKQRQFFMQYEERFALTQRKLKEAEEKALSQNSHGESKEKAAANANNQHMAAALAEEEQRRKQMQLAFEKTIQSLKTEMEHVRSVNVDAIKQMDELMAEKAQLTVELDHLKAELNTVNDRLRKHLVEKAMLESKVSSSASDLSNQLEQQVEEQVQAKTAVFQEQLLQARKQMDREKELLGQRIQDLTGRLEKEVEARKALLNNKSEVQSRLEVSLSEKIKTLEVQMQMLDEETRNKRLLQVQLAEAAEEQRKLQGQIQQFQETHREYLLSEQDLRNRLSILRERFELLLEQAGVVECPFCQEFVPKLAIQSHVEKNHSQDL